MDKKSFLKFLAARGAIIYTAISTVLITFALFLAEDASTKILVPKRFLFLLIFSYILALGSAFFKSGFLPDLWARLVHALCFIGGFVLFMILCQIKFAPLVISSAIFAFVYVAVTLISSHKRSKSEGSPSATKASSPKNKKSTVEYTPMFKTDRFNGDGK